MDSGTRTYTAPSHEDTSTEWDDIQARLGNAPAREKPPAFTKFVVDALEQPSEAKASRASDDEGEDALDDDDDDEYLQQYRERRMAEMLESASARREGVREITRASFVDEVTKPSAERYVVVLMTRHGCKDCETMERALEALTLKFPGTKFVKIPHRECVPNYPDHLAPTLLVYKDGDVARTLATLAPFGGAHMTPEGVELALREVHPSVCPTPREESLEEEERRRAAYVAGVVARTLEAQRREREMDETDIET